MEVICYRFKGQWDPLEELMELKQLRDLEEYIQDFDILWNKAKISEKQALVIFLGGLELELKNTMKMFEPQTLKHTSNLARLQANTLAYMKSSSFTRRSFISLTSQPNQITSPPPIKSHDEPYNPSYNHNKIKPCPLNQYPYQQHQ